MTAITRILPGLSTIRMRLQKLSPRCAEPGCFPRRWWQALSQRSRGVRMGDRWYCSPECFEAAAEREFRRLLSANSRSHAVQHRIPLGLLMLSRGQVSHRQIETALESQLSHGERLGQWLLRMGAVNEHDIALALGAQWSCPVFSLSNARSNSVDWVPLRLMESHRMLPVHFVTSRNLLYVAFSGGVDHSALYALEQMLGCHTEPCLVEETVLSLEVERARHSARDSEIVIEGKQTAAEMSHVSRNYALQWHAEEARIVLCGAYIWVRLLRSGLKLDLLFRSGEENRLRAHV